ncbi:MAG: IS110 family transposase [Pseudomonadota bacterium]
MEKISIIGLDIAKRVFQVHGVNEKHEVVVQRKLSRSEMLVWFTKLEPCLVGMEACATAHYWGRELKRLGHDVRLIPPAYVKPYVKRQKNDRVDAAAICEAVTRPAMRFVAIKDNDQQAVQVLHRTRELLIRQRVQLGNALRAHMAEFGWVFPLGMAGLTQAISAVRETPDADLPTFARQVLLGIADQIDILKKQISSLDKQMIAWHRAHAGSQRLATVPGIGVVTASAILAAIGDGKQFRSGRDFAASVGLVPRQNSSGGKDRLGRISKQGNPYLRRLFILGATTQLRGQRREKAAGGVWFDQLLKRKPARLASVALANKMARVAWAVLTKNESYRATRTVISPEGVVTMTV